MTESSGSLAGPREDIFCCPLFFSRVCECETDVLSRAWDKLGIMEQTAFRIGSIRNSTFNSQLRNDSVFQGTGGKHKCSRRVRSLGGLHLL